MRRRPPRNLNSEERKLWQKVAETAQPMHARRHSDTPKTEPVSPQKSKTPPTPRNPIGAFQVGALSPAKGARHHLAPSIEDAVAAAPVQMDRKNYDRLRKGKMVPEAKIDLHGMTMSQAHPALVNFVMRNHGRGARLVLVITGKGKSADVGGPDPRAPRRFETSGASVACPAAVARCGFAGDASASETRWRRGLLRVSAPNPLGARDRRNRAKDNLGRVLHGQNCACQKTRPPRLIPRNQCAHAWQLSKNA